MDSDLKLKLNYIVNFSIQNFDVNKQDLILVEEMAELTKEIMKMKNRKHDNIKNIIEEITHVLISLMVLKEILLIDDYKIIEEINKKINKYIGGIKK